MTFDIGLNEVCVQVGVRYVITKFSGMDSLPNFLTHGAPLRARELRYYTVFTVAWLMTVLKLFRSRQNGILSCSSIVGMFYFFIAVEFH